MMNRRNLHKGAVAQKLFAVLALCAALVAAALFLLKSDPGPGASRNPGTGSAAGNTPKRLGLEDAMERLKDFVAEFQSQMRRLDAESGMALQDFIHAGGIQPEGLDEDGAIERRLRALAAVERSVGPGVEFWESLPARARDAMKKAGIDEAELDDAVRGFLHGVNHEVLSEVSKLNREFCAASRELLDVLRDSRGSWSIDPAQDKVLFHGAGGEALGERHEKLLERISAMFRRHDELAKQYREQSERVARGLSPSGQPSGSD